MQQSLGLIETIGLAAAIEAADTALKTANVELIGYELSKGDGMVTVKIMGRVGAVEAGVKAAKMAASIVSKVVSTRVIPRPGYGLDKVIFTDETVNHHHENETPEIVKKEIDELSKILDEKHEENEVLNQQVTEEIHEKAEEVQEYIQEVFEEVIDVSNEEICNICGDPLCSRKKGQPKRYCAHYFKQL